ncbi:MAG: metallophosphatase [Candidatus Eremiobacteraeota bacterium]|nr:metallophosphatase [Candidatus Eremiobacteraeota bacterium]
MPKEEKAPERSSVEIPDVRTLTLLYTNDIQGEAEQMAYLATVAKQIKSSQSYTILVDAGNWSKGTLLSDYFKGMPMVEIMNNLKYDAVAIGEGEIDFGSKNLYSLEDKAEFPLLSCNIVESGTGIPPYFLKDKFTLIERGPFTIAIIAVSNPMKYPGAGIDAKDPFEVLPGVIEEIIKHKPDIIILLSRLGLENDKKVANRFPQINVIVGGPDRLNLEDPVVQGDTYIVQSGEKASFLGKLSIDIEGKIRLTSVE